MSFGKKASVDICEKLLLKWSVIYHIFSSECIPYRKTRGGPKCSELTDRESCLNHAEDSNLRPTGKIVGNHKPCSWCLTDHCKRSLALSNGGRGQCGELSVLEGLIYTAHLHEFIDYEPCFPNDREYI